MRLLLAALAIVCLATPAAAQEWWEASTDHFRVFSQGDRDEAIELAVKLERLDQAMRYLQNIPQDDGPVPESTKLTMYRFGTTQDIGRLAGGRGVAGFYVPRAGRSVAFTPRREDIRRGSIGVRDSRGAMTPEIVMFHEYTHYFMYQHRPAAYPAWYSEGFAEVYGTLQLIDNGFIFGAPAEHRAFELRRLRNYDVRELLDPGDELTMMDVIQRYAMGWMLAHYLTFTEERQGQLGTYLTLLNSGLGSIEAGEEAFGDLDQLDSDIDDYRRARNPVRTITFPDYVPPEATVRQLGEDEVAMMDMHMKSSRGVTEEQALSLVDDARQLASRYPNSLPVTLAVTEAFFDAKLYEESEAAAHRALAMDENNTRALLYLGHIAMQRAKEDPAQFEEARLNFAAANRSQPLNPEALYNYYLSYRLSQEQPTENALIALETAYEFARFDENIRLSLGELLFTENRDNEAYAVLGPLLNYPHPRGIHERAIEAIEKLEEGNREEALAMLAPTFDDLDGQEEEEDGDDEDDEDDEGEDED